MKDSITTEDLVKEWMDYPFPEGVEKLKLPSNMDYPEYQHRVRKQVDLLVGGIVTNVGYIDFLTLKTIEYIISKQLPLVSKATVTLALGRILPTAWNEYKGNIQRSDIVELKRASRDEWLNATFPTKTSQTALKMAILSMIKQKYHNDLRAKQVITILMHTTINTLCDLKPKTITMNTLNAAVLESTYRLFGREDKLSKFLVARSRV